jgi:hypothetical protein
MTETEVVEFALDAIRSQGSPTFVLDPDRPDELVRDAPAVDFTARTSHAVLAIEHTRGEPYEGFLADWNLSHQRLGPVQDLLAGRLPDDSSFNISFSPATAKRIATADAEGIADWIAEAAPTLGAPKTRTHFAKTPPEVSRVELTIYRWPYADGEPRDPQIRYRIGVDTDKLQEALTDRYRRAMATKLPKLEAARSDLSAALTMFCVETADFQITNAWELGGVFRAEVGELPLPDYIVVVMIDPNDRPGMSWTYREPGGWLAEPRFYSPDTTIT